VSLAPCSTEPPVQPPITTRQSKQLPMPSTSRWKGPVASEARQQEVPTVVVLDANTNLLLPGDTEAAVALKDVLECGDLLLRTRGRIPKSWVQDAERSSQQYFQAYQAACGGEVSAVVRQRSSEVAKKWEACLQSWRRAVPAPGTEVNHALQQLSATEHLVAFANPDDLLVTYAKAHGRRDRLEAAVARIVGSCEGRFVVAELKPCYRLLEKVFFAGATAQLSDLKDVLRARIIVPGWSEFAVALRGFGPEGVLRCVHVHSRLLSGGEDWVDATLLCTFHGDDPDDRFLFEVDLVLEEVEAQVDPAQEALRTELSILRGILRRQEKGMNSLKVQPRIRVNTADSGSPSHAVPEQELPSERALQQVLKKVGHTAPSKERLCDMRIVLERPQMWDALLDRVSGGR